MVFTCYHVTARENLPSILRHYRLYPAEKILAKVAPDLIRVRRPGEAKVTFDGKQITIRDQKPLRRELMSVGDDKFAEIVQVLNGYVFFWPGGREDIPAQALRMYERSASPQTVLRLPLVDLRFLNPGLKAYGTTENIGANIEGVWNSCVDIDTTLRRLTFELDERGLFSAHEVIFKGTLLLPPTTEFAICPEDPWLPFSRTLNEYA